MSHQNLWQERTQLVLGAENLPRWPRTVREQMLCDEVAQIR